MWPPAEIAVVLPLPSERLEVVENVEPAPVTAMVVVFGAEKPPVKTASPPACTVSVFPAARLNAPVESRVSWPPLSVTFPFALKVPPVIANVPVLLIVVSPVPLLKVPLFCKVNVPVLPLAPPIVAVGQYLQGHAKGQWGYLSRHQLFTASGRVQSLRLRRRQLGRFGRLGAKGN